jgi:CRP/FNR family transcriptional regulator, anaerobic regulatory protein
MFDRLKISLVGLLPLTPEEFIHFVTLLTPRRLSKHEHYLQAGEVCTHIAFINQGSMRYYYLKDGNEFNGQFFFEGSWIGEYQSFLTGQPSLQYFDALENVELLVMHHRDLQKLYADLPKFERFGRALAENVVIGSQHRTASLLFDTPEERYLKLISDRPKVVERIPLYHIASYLGIKPESLSRIRKRLADER